MNYPNIYSLFADRVAAYRDSTCDVFYFRSSEKWQGISWNQFAQESVDFSTAALALGLKKGGAIAILMGNVPEWPISDIGTIAAGGVGVGLYPTSSAEQCRFIINHSEAEFVLVDTQSQLEKILAIRSELLSVKHIIVLDEKAASNADAVISYQDLLRRGREQTRAVSAAIERAS
jgi:long-chain acyl-CoA synthetase